MYGAWKVQPREAAVQILPSPLLPFFSYLSLLPPLFSVETLVRRNRILENITYLHLLLNSPTTITAETTEPGYMLTQLLTPHQSLISTSISYPLPCGPSKQSLSSSVSFNLPDRKELASLLIIRKKSAECSGDHVTDPILEVPVPVIIERGA
jgi:hypothetical protein